MYEVTMPKLSDSMEVGQIVEWKVKEGDRVSEGDVLAEVESDKAVMELECYQDGVVAKIVHGGDTEVPVGEVIAFIGEEGEEVPEGEPAPIEPPATPEPVAPAQEPEAPTVPPPPPPPPLKPAPRADAGRVTISPYARKLAVERGIDCTRVQGSGPGGRIVAADVEAAASGAVPLASPVRSSPVAATPDPTPVPGGDEVQRLAQAVTDFITAQAPRVKPSADEELPAIEVSDDEAEVEEAPFRLRTQIRRVVAAKHVIPHFYLTRSIDVTELLGRKAELKERYRATITHLVMLACLKALHKHPEINRSYDRGRIIKWKGVNLGIAIGTDEGLTVAVMRNAQRLGLADLAQQTPDLVERARSGKLKAEERQHATFTISNLGMYDVEHFQPIVNPPSAVTLGVASALPTPVIRDDAIFFGQVMRLTASCDHRIIDGVAAAQFMQTLRSLLEDPDELLRGQ